MSQLEGEKSELNSRLYPESCLAFDQKAFTQHMYIPNDAYVYTEVFYLVEVKNYIN